MTTPIPFPHQVPEIEIPACTAAPEANALTVSTFGDIALMGSDGNSSIDVLRGFDSAAIGG